MFYHSTQPVSSSQTGQIPRICACASWAKPNVKDTHHDLDSLFRKKDLTLKHLGTDSDGEKKKKIVSVWSVSPREL